MVKRVCIIGGGGAKTSLSALLRINDIEISSIVTVFDSGGSTGILRKEFGVYALGDIRDHLLAASQNRSMVEVLSKRVELGGVSHSLGNLFLLSAINEYGKAYMATVRATLQLPERVEVIPVTDNVYSKTNLVVMTMTSERIVGEHNLDSLEDIKVKGIALEAKENISRDAKKAVVSADTIVFGPGDVYSSVLPNMLVGGMKEAIIKSRAKKVLVLNIMNKINETEDYRASDFIGLFERYGVSFNTIIVNSKVPRKVDTIAQGKYGKLYGFIENDLKKEDAMNADLIDETVPYQHDPDKLAAAFRKVI
jgi:uncharacterized cofD-like protein